MRNLKCILIAFIMTGMVGYAQPDRSYETNPDRKRTNYWYFGEFAGIDFNTKPPTALTNGKINTWEGCSSISDTSGKLIIYTDGITVWDKNHNIIETGLLGHISSAQSALIVKHPENDSLIYIITTPLYSEYYIGIRFSIYNTRTNKITSKNSILGNNSSERVATVNHRNGKDIWVTWHKYGDNCFYSILLSKIGFIDCSVQSCIGTDYYNLFDGLFVNQGQIKFSDNGKLVAQTLLNAPNDGFEYFSFDNATGKIFNQSVFNSSFFPTSLEFSAYSDYFVISSRDSSLIAYDIKSNTKKIVYPIHNKNNRISSVQKNSFGDIIYSILDSTKIGKISKGKFGNISYDNNYLDLNGRKCNSGLPNFNQSYFYTPSIDFTYEYNCSNNKTSFQGRDTFNANTHNWQIMKIGKPIEATYTTKNFNHSFIDTGSYQIRYIAINGSRKDTVKKEIIIYPKINKNFLGKDTFYGQGTSINKTLKAPVGMHCYIWLPDSSLGSSYIADTAGIYIAKVNTQAFCVVTDTIIITECINDLTVPNIYRSSDTLYTFHQTADSFVWYRNNNFYKITKTPFLILTDTGLYWVEAAKKGHCNRSSSTQYVNKLGIHSIDLNAEGIKLFPNPAKDHIVIVFNKQETYQILIYNALGQKMYDASTNANININLNHFLSGVYLVQIINTKHQQFNTTILKE